MFDLIDNIETILPVYLLVFVRLTTMMIIMPIFSHALILVTSPLAVSFPAVLTVRVIPELTVIVPTVCSELHVTS